MAHRLIVTRAQNVRQYEDYVVEVSDEEYDAIRQELRVFGRGEAFDSRLEARGIFNQDPKVEVDSVDERDLAIYIYEGGAEL